MEKKVEIKKALLKQRKVKDEYLYAIIFTCLIIIGVYYSYLFIIK